MTNISATSSITALPFSKPPALSPKVNDGDGDNDAKETAANARTEGANTKGVNLIA